MLFLPRCPPSLLTPCGPSSAPSVSTRVSCLSSSREVPALFWRGGLGNPQPCWVEILRDTSPPAPSHAFSISFHFPLSFRSHCLASLPPTPTANQEWMGEGQTRALEGVLWLCLGRGAGFLAGDRAQWVPGPPALSLVNSGHGSYPEPGCLGFGQIQVWIRGVLQRGDDGGRVDQGIPEAEIAQHSSEGSQEHSLVLQDPGVCGGSAEPSGSLSPPTSDCCLA